MARYFVAFLRTLLRRAVTRRFGSTATCSPITSSANGRSSNSGSTRSSFRPSCLRKSTVNVYSKYSQKKRAEQAPVRNRSRLRALDGDRAEIYGAIQEYGGFERPEWLG